MSIDHLGLDEAPGGTPPHDELAEQSVLGAMMLSKDAAYDAIAIVKPGDYYHPKHDLIHTAILALMNRGSIFEVIAVIDELAKTGQLQRAGGAEYLHTLTGIVPTARNAGYYAQIVRDKAIRRRLVEAGTRITQMGYASEGEVRDLVENARSEIDATMKDAQGKPLKVSDILPEVIDRLDSKESPYVPSPWPTLNKSIGGFRPGNVYIVAARPGIGKSIVAAQIAVKLAERGLVAFASLEMSGDELVSRLISERLEIRAGKLNTPGVSSGSRLTDRDWEIIRDGRGKLEDLDIYIDDRTDVAAIDIRAYANRVAREGPLAGVIVDYMQLMSSPSKFERQVQVAEFSRQLKVLAKTLKVPVIALSQLNRKSEERVDREPRLADLRESGAIEQDASVVILLRREGEYPNEHLWMNVAKNRHGETGDVDLAWQGEFSRAVEWDADLPNRQYPN